jgi:hypothetical protein
VQRKDVSAATRLERLDDQDAPAAKGVRNVEKVLM